MRFKDELSLSASSPSLLDLISDVKDDVFMGYNEDQAMPTMDFKMELDDNDNDVYVEEIDQVVPIHFKEEQEEDNNCEDSTLDVIVLYVN